MYIRQWKGSEKVSFTLYIHGRGVWVNIFCQEKKCLPDIADTELKMLKIAFLGVFWCFFLEEIFPILLKEGLYFIIHSVNNNFYFHDMKCLMRPQTMDSLVPSIPILEPSEGQWQAVASRNWKIPFFPTLIHVWFLNLGGVGYFWTRT